MVRGGRAGHLAAGEFGGGIRWGGERVGEGLVGGFAESSEAAFALLIVGDGFEEMEAAEVGPEAVGDEDLGVGDLPQEEVGDALLAGGADDEVGVGHVSGIEAGVELRLVDAGLDGIVDPFGGEHVFDGDAALVGFSDEIVDEGAGGVDDLGAGTVVEGESEGGAGVFGRLLGGPLHGVLHLLREFMRAADVCHADVVVVHALDIGEQVAAQELHEEVDFIFGAAEVVFEREGVEGDPGEIDARGGLDDELNALGTLLVAEETLEGALASPAAIAVHDDGDVLRHARGIERVVEDTFFGREFVDPVGAMINAAGGGFAHDGLLRMTIAEKAEVGNRDKETGRKPGKIVCSTGVRRMRRGATALVL